MSRFHKLFGLGLVGLMIVGLLPLVFTSQPAMEAILADWYWQYFQHNRWRFLQRTQTAAAPALDWLA